MKPDGSDVKQVTNLGSKNTIATYESWSLDGKQMNTSPQKVNSARGNSKEEYEIQNLDVHKIGDMPNGTADGPSHARAVFRARECA
jgi:Tol biopolymer transport system component